MFYNHSFITLTARRGGSEPYVYFTGEDTEAYAGYCSLSNITYLVPGRAEIWSQEVYIQNSSDSIETDGNNTDFMDSFLFQGIKECFAKMATELGIKW